MINTKIAQISKLTSYLPLYKISSTLLLCILSGCSTVYVEQETPPGYVVPPIPQSHNIPRTTSLIDSGTMEMESPGSYHSTVSGNMSNSGLNASQYSFMDAYNKAKQPKLAFFLYRELTQDILDYDSNQRLVFSGRNNKNQSNLVIAKQNKQNIDSGTRYLTNQDWAWRFENKLIDDFVASGVRLIDRSTIMRLVAADVDEARDSTGMLNSKKIEIDALRGHVDIFIEILAIPSKDYIRRYDYKVTAKQVADGRIIAVLTTIGKDIENYGTGSIEPVGNVSDNIQPRQNKNIKQNYMAEDIAGWVSWSIQQKLTSYWSR